MDGRSGRGARLVCAMAAAALLLGCFTTACQPAETASGRYDGLIRQVTEAGKQDIAMDKAVIADQIDKLGGRMRMDIEANPQVVIHVDAEIVPPGDGPVPLVRISPKNPSQKQFEAFMEYIAPGQPLYYLDLYDSLTKEEIDAELKELRGYMEDDQLSPYIKKDIQFRIDDLTGSYEHAKTNAELKPYDGTITPQYGNTAYSTVTYLKCFMGKDKAATINFYQSISGARSQIVLYNGMYNAEEPYAGADAERINVTYAQAKTTAENLVRKLAGKNTDIVLYDSGIGYRLGTYDNYTKETSPQAYVFHFGHRYHGTVAKSVIPLFGRSQEFDNSRAVDPEAIAVTIDNGGIATAVWLNHSETGKTIAKDVPLLDFDTVSGIFEEYCGRYPWLPQYSESNLPGDVGVTLHVKRVEMNLMVLAENDDLSSCITVPVWDFIADEEYDREVSDEEGRPFPAQKDACILTINAIDGTVLDREKGY